VTDLLTRILRHVAAVPGTTSIQVAAALGIETRAATKRLSDAHGRRYLTREGAPGAYRYTATRAGILHCSFIPPVRADDLPERAAAIVRDEPYATTAEVAADLDVDAARTGLALRVAESRGWVVGERVAHRGRAETVWRAVGLRVVTSLGATA